MTQKVYAEGLRALHLYTAAHQDETAAAVIPRRRHDGAASTTRCPTSRASARERAYQCLTGIAADVRRSGYPPGLPDRAVHPRRQDRLCTRAPPRSRPRTSFPARSLAIKAALSFHWLARSASSRWSRLGGAGGRPGPLRTAVDDVTAMVGTLTGILIASRRTRGSSTGWAWVRPVPDGRRGSADRVAPAATGAHRLRGPGPDQKQRPRPTATYEGKIAAAVFFATTVLPRFHRRPAHRREHHVALMDGRGRVLILQTNRVSPMGSGLVS